jgi:HAD superfamily hydrolase (TIGR01484 family)
MSRIKLAALDLDGTLLAPDHQVSAANRVAVAACLDAGIHVVLASGRSFSSMLPIARALGSRHTICLNGAALGDAEHDTVTPRRLLSWEQVALVSEELLRRGVPFCLFGLRELVSLPGWAEADTLIPYGEPPISTVPALTPASVPEPIKFLAFAEAGPLDAELEAATAGVVEQVRTHQRFLEWMAPGASKGAALQDRAIASNSAWWCGI